MGHCRRPVGAVHGDVTDYVQIGGVAASAEYDVLKDHGAWGAVQGRLSTALPLDSTGSDGWVVFRLGGPQQGVLSRHHRQQKRYEQYDQSKSHLIQSSGSGLPGLYYMKALCPATVASASATITTNRLSLIVSSWHQFLRPLSPKSRQTQARLPQIEKSGLQAALDAFRPYPASAGLVSGGRSPRTPGYRLRRPPPIRCPRTCGSRRWPPPSAQPGRSYSSVDTTPPH